MEWKICLAVGLCLFVSAIWCAEAKTKKEILHKVNAEKAKAKREFLHKVDIAEARTKRKFSHKTDATEAKSTNKRYTSYEPEFNVDMASVCGFECRYSNFGTDYRGRRAVTISGRTCQRWDSQYPQEHSRNDVSQFPDAIYNDANYCRNPDHEAGSGPWCYTTDPDLRWETCGIPLCPDCIPASEGYLYLGQKSVTVSGRTCQDWDSQYPQEHSRNDVTQFPDAVYNEANYCRNPDHESTGPWCYTTDLEKRWETCGIPACTECRHTELGTEYSGSHSVTISGRTCQNWNSQYPHEHTRNDVSEFPDAAYNEANYCRNPDHEHGVGPWCYTTDPNVRWETCGIPYCT